MTVKNGCLIVMILAVGVFFWLTIPDIINTTMNVVLGVINVFSKAG